jgi:putative toxin-antitoxin system antitoxin component (TIGR02293 family)
MHREALLPELDEATRPPQEVIEFVSKGLAFDALARVARAYGVTQQVMAGLIGVSPRTLQRRRANGCFDASESERLYRFIRLYRRALDVFDEDEDAAREFLTEAQPGLASAVPAEMARSEYGAAEVMDLLGRIDHGVYT